MRKRTDESIKPVLLLKNIDKILLDIKNRLEYDEMKIKYKEEALSYISYLDNQNYIDKVDSFNFRITIKGIEKLANGGFYGEFLKSKVNNTLLRIFWVFSSLGVIYLISKFLISIFFPELLSSDTSEF